MKVGDLVRSKAVWDYHGIVVHIAGVETMGGYSKHVTVLWKDGLNDIHSMCYLEVISESD